MERFDTMLEAAEFAATLCKNWSFATSNDRYDVKSLLVLAETSDSEDEDLPATYQVYPQINFCPKCGSGVVSGARFCRKCGNRL